MRQLRTPPTSAEIALSYENQYIYRKSQRKFAYVGMLLTLIVGGLLTIAAHYYSRRLTRIRRYQYRVVVSLGTTPSKLASMQPLLESLIEKQSTSPRVVYLVLPQGTPEGDKLYYEIPDYVSNYVDQKKIYLLTPVFDYGPITKVLYSIKVESDDARIICMDGSEDVDSNFVSTFLDQSLQYSESAIAFSGASLQSYFRPATQTTTAKNPLVFEGTRLAKTVDVLQGPIMVQRRFFDLEAFTETVTESRQSVRSAADFILAAHLEVERVDRKLVPRSRRGEPLAPSGAGSFAYLEAAYYLQQQLGIWKGFKFHNPKILSDDEKDAINCDGGSKSACRNGYKDLLQKLDSKSL